MKNLILSTLLLMNFNNAFAQMKPEPGEEKDWVLDPKTSTLIPKYLGKIKVLRGKAIIGDRDLKQGSKIYNNDLLQTLENSYVVMEMIDLTTITLGPQSDFKVSGWKYRTKNDREAEYNVLKGQWRALVREKSKEMDQLKIKTPVVSMGIRGTELMVNVLKNKDSDVTQVALLEGSIHMETTDGKKQELIPGDHAVVLNSPKGFEHADKKLNVEELKNYRELDNGIPRLLHPQESAANEVSQAGNNNSSADQKISLTDAAVSAKKPKDKTVKENLEILNTTREKNRKQEDNKKK